MILRDFQICSPPALLERQREIAHRLFPFYEAVRLDLKVRRPRAPFRKIVVSLVDRTHGLGCRVTNCLGICEVFVPVEITQFLSGEILSLVPYVVQGLDAIADATGFRDPNIVEVLQRCDASDPPCSHVFTSLTKVSSSRTTCETWFTARPGYSSVEVRLSDSTRSLVFKIKEISGPLFVEDDFPVRFSRIRDGRYELLDRNGAVLAQVPVAS